MRRKELHTHTLRHIRNNVSHTHTLTQRINTKREYKLEHNKKMEKKDP